MQNPGGRRPREHRVRRMGYRKLEEIALKDDPTDTLLTISSTQNGFLQLLDSDDLQPDWVTLILRILHTGLSSDSSPTLSKPTAERYKDLKIHETTHCKLFS